MRVGVPAATATMSVALVLAALLGGLSVAHAADSVQQLVERAEAIGDQRPAEARRLLVRALRRNRTTHEVAKDKVPLLKAWIMTYAGTEVSRLARRDFESKGCRRVRGVFTEVKAYAPTLNEALAHPAEARFQSWPLLLAMVSFCETERGNLRRAQQHLTAARRFEPIFSNDPNDGLVRACHMAEHNLGVARRKRGR